MRGAAAAILVAPAYVMGGKAEVPASIVGEGDGLYNSCGGQNAISEVLFSSNLEAGH
jgi:hypothetical protein